MSHPLRLARVARPHLLDHSLLGDSLLGPRILGSLGVSLALVGGLAVAAQADTPAAATTPLTSTLTLSSAAKVSAGRAFTVSGRLVENAPSTTTPTGTGTSTTAPIPAKTGAVAGAPVVLQWRTVGSTHWTGSRTVLTSSKGTWSTTLSVGLNSQLRARYAGAAASATTTGAAVPAVAASRTATSTVTALQSLTIAKLSPSRPAIGQLLSVSGTASKALRGTTISLQRLSGTRWTTVTTAKVSSTGSYASTIRISSAAALSLRTRSTTSATITRAYSARRSVSVALSATLYPGQTLGARRVLTAPNGLYTATVQTDGNLVVRNSTGTQLWASGTSGASPTLSLSSTGNVVLAGKAGALWSSGLATPTTAPRLVLQNDGNLVLWSKAHSLWSWQTGPSTTVQPAACWSTSFDCISYTSYTPSTSYWRMYAGHNCTNYVAYRMSMKGVTTPPWGLPGGSAWAWRAGAVKAGVTVDQVPAVGAVMQWNRNTYGGGSSGHVVYVERVTTTGVVISEDSWSGHASVRTILKTSPSYATARFLHIADTV